MLTKRNIPQILLVNPWIHDFAAYDFWAKPMGLLTLGSILYEHGYGVSYIDCLNRFHPESPQKNPYSRHGRGPYYKTRISKPKGLEDIPRNFSCYGIKPEWFIQDLMAVDKPDLILVTSLMTYWYPGVQQTICIIKQIFPNTPVILGGIYARLCYDHAKKYSGADMVWPENGALAILDIVKKYTGFSSEPKFNLHDFNSYPLPGLNFQTKITYVPLITSIGCPFKCAYCASHFLEPKYTVKTPEKILQEIFYWYDKYQVKDFVFYDDALLINAKDHIIPILKGVIQSGINIRFHTPNAVHIREITDQIAELMFAAGFRTLRLGLETTAFEKRNKLDRKVNEDEFKKACTCLIKAGFEKKQIGAYLLTGLPGQTFEAVEASVITVKETGITPVPAYYTPIPHTALWPEAVASSRYDLEADPVFTNNAVFPCWPLGFSWEIISRLKNLIH